MGLIDDVKQKRDPQRRLSVGPQPLADQPLINLETLQLDPAATVSFTPPPGQPPRVAAGVPLDPAAEISFSPFPSQAPQVAAGVPLDPAADVSFTPPPGATPAAPDPAAAPPPTQPAPIPSDTDLVPTYVESPETTAALQSMGLSTPQGQQIAPPASSLFELKRRAEGRVLDYKYHGEVVAPNLQPFEMPTISASQLPQAPQQLYPQYAKEYFANEHSAENISAYANQFVKVANDDWYFGPSIEDLNKFYGDTVAAEAADRAAKMAAWQAAQNPIVQPDYSDPREFSSNVTKPAVNSGASGGGFLGNAKNWLTSGDDHGDYGHGPLGAVFRALDFVGNVRRGVLAGVDQHLQAANRAGRAGHFRQAFSELGQAALSPLPIAAAVRAVRRPDKKTPIGRRLRQELRRQYIEPIRAAGGHSFSFAQVRDRQHPQGFISPEAAKKRGGLFWAQFGAGIVADAITDGPGAIDAVLQLRKIPSLLRGARGAGSGTRTVARGARSVAREVEVVAPRARGAVRTSRKLIAPVGHASGPTITVEARTVSRTVRPRPKQTTKLLPVPKELREPIVKTPKGLPPAPRDPKLVKPPLLPPAKMAQVSQGKVTLNLPQIIPPSQVPNNFVVKTLAPPRPKLSIVPAPESKALMLQKGHVLEEKLTQLETLKPGTPEHTKLLGEVQQLKAEVNTLSDKLPKTPAMQEFINISREEDSLNSAIAKAAPGPEKEALVARKSDLQRLMHQHVTDMVAEAEHESKVINAFPTFARKQALAENAPKVLGGADVLEFKEPLTKLLSKLSMQHMELEPLVNELIDLPAGDLAKNKDLGQRLVAALNQTELTPQQTKSLEDLNVFRAKASKPLEGQTDNVIQFPTRVKPQLEHAAEPVDFVGSLGEQVAELDRQIKTARSRGFKDVESHLLNQKKDLLNFELAPLQDFVHGTDATLGNHGLIARDADLFTEEIRDAKRVGDTQRVEQLTTEANNRLPATSIDEVAPVIKPQSLTPSIPPSSMVESLINSTDATPLDAIEATLVPRSNIELSELARFLGHTDNPGVLSRKQLNALANEHGSLYYKMGKPIDTEALKEIKTRIEVSPAKADGTPQLTQMIDKSGMKPLKPSEPLSLQQEQELQEAIGQYDLRQLFASETGEDVTKLQQEQQALVKRLVDTPGADLADPENYAQLQKMLPTELKSTSAEGIQVTVDAVEMEKAGAESMDAVRYLQREEERLSELSNIQMDELEKRPDRYVRPAEDLLREQVETQAQLKKLDPTLKLASPLEPTAAKIPTVRNMVGHDGDFFFQGQQDAGNKFGVQVPQRYLTPEAMQEYSSIELPAHEAEWLNKWYREPKVKELFPHLDRQTHDAFWETFRDGFDQVRAIDAGRVKRPKKILKQRVELINNFINNPATPHYEGEVFRGMNFTGKNMRKAEEAFLAAAKRGEPIQLNAFSSFSRGEHVAELYTQDSYIKLRVAQSTRGVDIDSITKDIELQEVLFAKGTRFKPINVSRDENGYTVIDLVEETPWPSAKKPVDSVIPTSSVSGASTLTPSIGQPQKLEEVIANKSWFHGTKKQVPNLLEGNPGDYTAPSHSLGASGLSLTDDADLAAEYAKAQPNWDKPITIDKPMSDQGVVSELQIKPQKTLDFNAPPTTRQRDIFYQAAEKAGFEPEVMQKFKYQLFSRPKDLNLHEIKEALLYSFNKATPGAEFPDEAIKVYQQEVSLGLRKAGFDSISFKGADDSHEVLLLGGVDNLPGSELDRIPFGSGDHLEQVVSRVNIARQALAANPESKAAQFGENAARLSLTVKMQQRVKSMIEDQHDLAMRQVDNVIDKEDALETLSAKELQAKKAQKEAADAAADDARRDMLEEQADDICF